MLAMTGKVMSTQNTTFEPLTTLTERTAVLRGPNTDTDQIIPARFLKKDRTQGYGQFLFHDMRFSEDGSELSHPLNASESERPRILVVEENFGCGSSREGAVYALADYGVRVVVGTTFGDIFHNNCFKNGVLPVRLTDVDHAKLVAALQSDEATGQVTVSLQDQKVSWNGGEANFDVDAFWKECLLKGLDELSLTLTYRDQIDAFEARYKQDFPWVSGVSM